MHIFVRKGFYFVSSDTFKTFWISSFHGYMGQKHMFSFKNYKIELRWREGMKNYLFYARPIVCFCFLINALVGYLQSF